MSSNHCPDAGYLLNLITTNTRFYHELKHRESQFTAKLRNSLNVGLLQLVAAGGITEEDTLKGIQQREEVCFWYTKMEYSRPGSGQEPNPKKRIKINKDNHRFHLTPRPSSTEADDSVDILYETASLQLALSAAQVKRNTSVPQFSHRTVDLSKSMDFGAQCKLPDFSSLMVDMGSWDDVEEQPGSDQQTLAVNLLDQTRVSQDANKTLTVKEKATVALKVTIEELLKAYRPSGKKYPAVNQIISNNKCNLKKRLMEIIDNGEHVTEANLGLYVRSITEAVLPSTADQYQGVLQYLISAAKQPKMSKFGAAMYLVIGHHATWECPTGNNCPRV